MFFSAQTFGSTNGKIFIATDDKIVLDAAKEALGDRAVWNKQDRGRASDGNVTIGMSVRNLSV